MANRRRKKSKNPDKVRSAVRLHIERLECRRLLTGINVSVYLDLNQNGIFDSGQDIPAANRIVYVDLNDNGQFDPGEPLAFTNEQGWAFFDGLEKGDHRVRLLADETIQRIIDPFSVDEIRSQHYSSDAQWLLQGGGGIWGMSAEGLLNFVEPVVADSNADSVLEAQTLNIYQLGGQPTSVLQVSASEAWIAYDSEGQSRLAIFDPSVGIANHFVLSGEDGYRVDQLVGAAPSGVFAVADTFEGRRVQKLSKVDQEIVTTDLWESPPEYLAFLTHPEVFVGARVQEDSSIIELFSPSGQVIDSAVVPGVVEAMSSDPVSSRFAVSTDVSTTAFAISDNALAQLAVLAEAAAPIAMYANRLAAADRSDSGQLMVWNSSHWSLAGRYQLSDGSIQRVGLLDHGSRIVAVTDEQLHTADILQGSDQSVLVTTRNEGPVTARFGLQIVGQAPPLDFGNLDTRHTPADTFDFVDLRDWLSQYSDGLLWFALDSHPAGGVVNLTPDGQLTYTPSAGFSGSDTVQMTVYDGVQQANLEVSWQVTPAAQATVEITVDVPPFYENTAAGTQLGFVTVIDPNPGSAYRVITSDPRFRVEYGRLFLEGDVDFEQESTIELELTAINEQTQFSVSTTVLLNIINVPEAPGGVALVGNTVEENAASVMIGQLIVVDPDAEGDYEITVNDPRFAVVDDQLWLMQPLNYQSESEVHLTVTATDRNNSDLYAISSIVVSVNPQVVVATPKLSLSRSDVPESTPGAVVGLLTVDGFGEGTVFYEVSDPRFEVVDGVLRLSENSELDLQMESAIALSITAFDMSGLSATMIFPLTVVEPRSPWQNPINPVDVNGDGKVSAIDVLIIINHLNEHGSGPIVFPPGSGGGAGAGEPPFFPDVNGDGRITALDALLIINELNAAAAEDSSQLPGSGEDADDSDSNGPPLEAEGESAAFSWSEPVVIPMSPEDAELRRREAARLDAELEILLEQIARNRISEDSP